MFRAFCCVACALAMLLGGCVNRDVPQAPPAQAAVPEITVGDSGAEPAALRVAVNSTDLLNPYTLTTRMNRDLQYLLYDAPVKLDPSFQPQNDLAESVEMDGSVCTIRLRPGVRFSNGMALTSRDAAYSLGLCMQKDARYASITAVDAPDPLTLRITLARPDIWFSNLLTFPVIRDGSGGDPTPPGTGRYIPRGGKLISNRSHYSGEPEIQVVELVKAKSAREVGYLLMSGKIDMALLEPDASPFETAGSFPAQTNDMLYIGFNGEAAPGDNALLRRAVAKLVDREAIALTAYNGRALAAAQPINPAFYPGGPVPGPDIAGAGALLDEMGMDTLSEGGWRMLNEGEVTLKLAVNIESAGKREAAVLLKEQIERGKIHVELGEYTFDEYQVQVAAGECALYLGQVRLPENMDISALLSPSGALHYSLGDTQALYGVYLAARQGQTDYDAFLRQFEGQAPFIPLLFDQEIVAHSRNFYFSVVATAQDIFYNINKW